MGVRRLNDDALPGQDRERLRLSDQTVSEQDLRGRSQSQHDDLRDGGQRQNCSIWQRVVRKLSGQAQGFEGADLAAASTEDTPGVVSPDAQSSLEWNFKHGTAGVAHQRKGMVISEPEVLKTSWHFLISRRRYNYIRQIELLLLEDLLS